MSKEPYDESDILDDQIVIRRVNRAQHVVKDKNRDCERLSSKFYSMSSGINSGMSVDVESLIRDAGIDPVSWVSSEHYPGSVSLQAGCVRALDLQLGYDQIPENPYHAEVWMKTPSKRFSKAQKDGLADCASWYVAIAGVELK